MTDEAFALFSRPELARRLAALGLDVSYDWARGHRMGYRDAGGVCREVTDWLGGYGQAFFGHQHPELKAVWLEAAASDAPVMAQASWRAGAGRAARALCEGVGRAAGGAWRALFVNSGAEAVEAALKHASLRHRARLESRLAAIEKAHRQLVARPAHPRDGRALAEAAACLMPGAMPFPDRRSAVAALEAANRMAAAAPPTFHAGERAFHGKTLAATQLTENPAFRAPFAGIGLAASFLPVDDPEAWATAFARDPRVFYRLTEGPDGALALQSEQHARAAAALIEPVQGEGGIFELEADFARGLRAACDQHHVDLVIDEIQAGLGRCGAFLASEAWGVKGDAYVFAKALGGGLAKVGALVVDAERAAPGFDLIHTSTFAEDEPGCRVAEAALALLAREDLAGRAAALGAAIRRELEGLAARYPKAVSAVRGRGLMLGLEWASQAANPSHVIRMLEDQGYLGYAIAGYLLHEHGLRVAPTLSRARTLRLEPPVTLPETEIPRLISALTSVCEILEKANAHRLTRYMTDRPFTPEAASEPIADCSRPARALRNEPPRTAKRVAFVGHFVEAGDATLWDPSLGAFDAERLKRYQLGTHRVLGPTIYDRLHVRSGTGEEVHLSFIGLNVTSKSIERAMRTRDTAWLVGLVQEAVDKAVTAGCTMIGLGGYTSIVTDNGRRLDPRGVGLTTGNAFTVAMSLEALERSGRELGLALGRERVALLGAGGNIGSVSARILATRAAGLLLVGRAGGKRLLAAREQLYDEALTRWRAGETGGLVDALLAWPGGPALLAEAERADAPGAWLAERIGEHPDAPVRVSEDLAELATCRMILTCSNASAPVLLPEHVAPAGPVAICDLAVPADVDPAVEALRPEVRVVKGGLVAIPNDPAFRVGGIPLADGLAYACMSETLLLGLAGVAHPYAIGPIRPEQVHETARWGRAHGFELGTFKLERAY